jgi:hypothetical protein
MQPLSAVSIFVFVWTFLLSIECRNERREIDADPYARIFNVEDSDVVPLFFCEATHKDMGRGIGILEYMMVM